MATQKYHWTEFMCTNCGRKTTMPIHKGRPLPGRCPKKEKGPHRWVVNRKI